MSRDADVIVVGAGMAGVTTAWALRQVGIRSIVLEGRSCIGGSTPAANGRTFHATWVSHASVNPLIPIAAAKKIKLIPSDPSNLSLFEATGRSLPDDEIETMFALYGKAYAEVKCEAQRRRDRGRPDVKLSKVFPSVLDGMPLDLATRRGVEFFFNLSTPSPTSSKQRTASPSPRGATAISAPRTP